MEAIGEISPEARRLILSEEVKVDKNYLEALSGKPKEDVLELALSIENGTYEKPKPGPKSPALPEIEYAPYPPEAGYAPENTALPETWRPAYPPATGALSTNEYFSSMADSFFAELQKLTETSNATELKPALRSHIDKLEALYRLM